MTHSSTFSATPYITPNVWRSSFEILGTLALVLMGVFGIHHAIATEQWLLYAVFLVPLAFLFTRVFVLLHDLTHRTLFKKGWVNDLIGSLLGVIVLTPFYLWRKVHLIHHKEGGNTDKRPWLGDLNIKTIREYQQLTPLRKLRYRLYRNPLVMFCLGSIFVFMFDQRFCKKSTALHPVFGSKERWSVRATNVALLIVYSSLGFLFGWKFLVLGLLLPLWMSGIIGIYMFYVQHNFRKKYHVPSKEWNLMDSALKGSSFHDIPKILMWLTANIGYHHVHTLSTRIPFYRLPDCHRNEPIFHNAVTIRLRDLPAMLSYKIYDEEQGEMISWKEYRERY